MSRKNYQVRKGIESEPLIWGLSIQYWGIVVASSVTVIIVGFMSLFSSLQSGDGGWSSSLIFLGLGLAGVFVMKTIFVGLSKPKKHNFGKRQVYLNQNDLLENF